jgi:hypothetical protein
MHMVKCMETLQEGSYIQETQLYSSLTSRLFTRNAVQVPIIADNVSKPVQPFDFMQSDQTET